MSYAKSIVDMFFGSQSKEDFVEQVTDNGMPSSTARVFYDALIAHEEAMDEQHTESLDVIYNIWAAKNGV